MGPAAAPNGPSRYLQSLQHDVHVGGSMQNEVGKRVTTHFQSQQCRHYAKDDKGLPRQEQRWRKHQHYLSRSAQLVGAPGQVGAAVCSTASFALASFSSSMWGPPMLPADV